MSLIRAGWVALILLISAATLCCVGHRHSGDVPCSDVAQQQDAQVRALLAQKIDFRVESEDLRNAVEALNRVTRLNIVIDPALLLRSPAEAVPEVPMFPEGEAPEIEPYEPPLLNAT